MRRATDNDGAVTTSAAVPVRVDALPSISITSPANNTVFSAPASFSLTAAAADTDGTVARVDFYQGATLIGTASASPYSAAVSNLASGAYSFTAVATDNDGAQTTSSAVAITVNALPTVSLASPANNATFNAPASVPVAAQVADTDGTIARVEFYSGATLITTLSAAPYSFTWTGVPAGAYSLTARAIDNLGGTVTSSAVNITVNTAAAQLYFIHTDNLNTPRLVADATGTTVWRWDQTEPFGDSVPDENPSGFGNFELPLGMPGQYRDKETGIWQNWMRDYSANLGRYVESDPVGIRAGLNTYSYVFNTPLAATDVYGLRSQYADTDPYPQCGNDAMCRAGIPTPPPEEKPTPVPCKGKWIELPFTRDIGYQFTLNCTCHFSCSCPSGDAFPDPNPGQYTTSGKLIYTGRDPKKGDQCICPKPGPETR